MDKLPADRGTDAPDMEAPALMVEVPTCDLTLTPTMARSLAAALLAGADTIDLQPPM